MSKHLPATFLIVFSIIFGWFWKSSVLPDFPPLITRDCRPLFQGQSLRIDSSAYSRLLRIKGNLSAEVTLSVGNTQLRKSKFIKSQKSSNYYDIPALSHGVLNIPAGSISALDACISDYLTYSKGQFIVVYSDHLGLKQENRNSSLWFLTASLLLVFLSVRYSNPTVLAILFVPPLLLAAATSFIPGLYGAKAYYSPLFFLIPIGGAIATALIWQHRSAIGKLQSHLLSPVPWARPRRTEIIAWAMGIAAAVALAYLPMFTHVFRHDEWFYFFTFRGESHPLLKYIDWQIFLPSDRLIFRPIHHGMLALNMLLFGGNYVGPHILSALKHLTATALVCLFLWRIHPHRLVFLLTGLFALLATQIDPVAWPHVDAYIISTIFSLASALLFLKTLDERISIWKGFTLSSLLLAVAMLTTELAFPIPLILFCSYWALYRNHTKQQGTADKAIFIYATPYIVWGMLFAIHIALIYPNFLMSAQSTQVSLAKSILNALTSAQLGLIRILPVFTSTYSSDKIYVDTLIYWFLAASTATLLGLIRYKRYLTLNRDTAFFCALFIAPWVMVSVARSSYIDLLLTDYLPGLWTPTHYSYIANAFMVPALYSILRKPITSRPRISTAILIAICLLNGFTINHSLRRVSTETAPAKKQYDQIADFIDKHKNEPGFSFKLVERRERIFPFKWYAASFPETFFGKYINDTDPKYIIRFDPVTSDLNFWRPDQFQKSKINSWRLGLIGIPHDYTNSFQIPFTRVLSGASVIYAGTSEISNKQWASVMGGKLSGPAAEPVTGISWLQASEFIRRLNVAEKTTAYRLPTIKERDEMAAASRSLYRANIRRGKHRRDIDPGGRTVCFWLNESITSETYTYPATPRLCSGLLLSKNKLPEFYESAYPPDYYFHDTGLRVIRDFIPR